MDSESATFNTAHPVEGIAVADAEDYSEIAVTGKGSERNYDFVAF